PQLRGAARTQWAYVSRRWATFGGRRRFRRPMPQVSEFFGIAIYIQWEAASQHHVPHFHARYAEFRASFSIPDAEILAGFLPRKQTRLVQAWAELHGEELEQAWGRAVNNEHPGKIDPL